MNLKMKKKMGGEETQKSKLNNAMLCIFSTIVRMSNVRFTKGCISNSGRANKMCIKNFNGTTS